MFFPKKGFGEFFGRYLFNQLINGLEECHNSGVAHRDLKTENIMMNRDWILKIADFGYATLIEGKKGDGVLGTFLGTLSYCAPEILAKKPYKGTDADLFSTGVILFVLVTGKLPFGKAIVYDQYYRNFIKNDPKTFWKIMLPKVGNVSDDFMDLVNQMLSYDPKERPSFDSIRKHAWMQLETATDVEMTEEFQKRDSIVKTMKELEAQEEDKKKKSGSGGGVYRGENDEESNIDFEKVRFLEEFLETKSPYKVVCKAENADQVLGKVFNFFYEDKKAPVLTVSDKNYSIKANYKASVEELKVIPEADDYSLGVEVSIKKYNDDFMIEFFKSKGDKSEFYEVFDLFSEAQAV